MPAVIETVQVPVPEQAPDQPAKTDPDAAEAVSVTEVFRAKLAEQLDPQLIPAGNVVTVPVPAPVFLTVTANVFIVNVAVTVRAAFTVTTHALTPEQPPPLQPVNVALESAVAVSVTVVPLTKAIAHVPPQEIPVGELVIVPRPVPDFVTVSVNDGRD